jgi:hypothetical protein
MEVSFFVRRTSLRAVPQQLLGDGQSLHVAGTFVDPADFGIAIQLFDRVILGKAHTA